MQTYTYLKNCIIKTSGYATVRGSQPGCNPHRSLWRH